MSGLHDRAGGCLALEHSGCRAKGVSRHQSEFPGSVCEVAGDVTDEDFLLF